MYGPDGGRTSSYGGVFWSFLLDRKISPTGCRESWIIATDDSR